MIEVVGFGDDITQLEVKVYFDAFGPVRKISFTRDVEGEVIFPCKLPPKSMLTVPFVQKVALVQFETPDAVVRVLTSKHRHEENELQVRHYIPSSSHSNSAAIVTQTSTITKDDPTMISLDTATPVPGPVTIHSISAKSATVKPKGHQAATPSALLGFPANRVVAFEPMDSATEDLTALTAYMIRAAFERLAPVSMIDWAVGAKHGHVRFKQAVAKEIAKNILRESSGNGLDINGTRVKVEALEGEAERVFHMVMKEKEKSISATASDAMIALNARQMVKNQNNRLRPGSKKANKKGKQQQQRRGGKAASVLSPGFAVYEQRTGSKKIADVVGSPSGETSPSKGRKRILVDADDMNDGGNDGDGGAIRRIITPNKKAKVDLMEALFQSLGTSES
jgi:hypothetical protein